MVVLVWPYTSEEEHTRGIMEAGMPINCSISPSHSSVWMLNSRVREALETSVTCFSPLVSCQTSQLSTVPNRSCPFSAFSLAPGTLSRIHLILVPEK